MLKVIGSIMLIMSMGIIGIIIARNIALRPREIRSLENGLAMLETEVLFGLTPLPFALARVGTRVKGPTKELFLIASQYLKSGEGLTAGEAWEIALQQLEKNSSLLQEDLEILHYFGQSLGGSDKEEQAKSFKLVQNHLRNAETKAEEIKNKNVKVWQYLGFGFGGIITLMLL